MLRITDIFFEKSVEKGDILVYLKIFPTEPIIDFKI